MSRGHQRHLLMQRHRIMGSQDGWGWKHHDLRHPGWMNRTLLLVILSPPHCSCPPRLSLAPALGSWTKFFCVSSAPLQKLSMTRCHDGSYSWVCLESGKFIVSKIYYLQNFWKFMISSLWIFVLKFAMLVFFLFPFLGFLQWSFSFHFVGDNAKTFCWMI